MKNQKVRFSYLDRRAFNVRSYYDGYQLAQELHVPKPVEDNEEVLEDVMGPTNYGWNKRNFKKNRKIENTGFKTSPPADISSTNPQAPTTNHVWNKVPRGGYRGSTRGRGKISN